VALAEHDLGHAEQSKSALDPLIAGHAIDSAYQIATVYAWSGDSDNAFLWLERVISQHNPGLAILTYDPLLRGLRADPRFAALCRKVGLPAPDGVPVSTAAGASMRVAESAP
jgi:serine/threonine-protein kinase